MLSKIHELQDSKWARQIAKYVFYLAVVIEVMIVIIDKSRYINPIEGRLFQLTLLLCLVKMLFTKYDWKDYLIILIFGCVGLWVKLGSNHNEYLRAVVFMAACKDMDLKNTLKTVFFETLFGSLVIVFLSLTGIYGELVVAKEYVGEGIVRRYAFGMGNSNAFHCMFFVTVLLGIYIFEKHVKWWAYISLFIGNLLLFLLTDSKTSMALTALTIIVMAVKKYADEKKLLRLIRFFSLACIVMDYLLILISAVFASQAYKIYEFKWSRLEESTYIRLLVKLDNLLTGRISSLMNYDSRAGSITTWSIKPVLEHTEYFDLGFVRLFYWYGIIPALLIIGAFSWLMIYLYKNKAYSEIIFLSMIAVYTLVEAHFVSVYIGRCYPLFVMGCYFGHMTEIGKIKNK